MRSFIKIIFSFYLITLISFLLFFFYEFYSNNGIEFNFCISQKCFDFVSNHFGNLISLFDWIVTSSAIFFAAASLLINFKVYQSSVKNNKMSNHLGHLSFFNNYLESEVSNLEHVSILSLNNNKLYFFIFPRSVDGEILVSDEYKDKISDIRQLLINSSKNKGVHFDYRTHQNSLISHLDEMGISMVNMHKKRLL
ncbi:retron Ec48 family effector membrane protein [Pseudoalteromonas sp. SW0106-04]|uniref:retron Ec48 family effector membrane protein n=1 Tax=Pseudoalteromonas sp. SW0106-04 TaxID=1702169 RepID=UPI0006B4CB73|nr:retron Ec48 family effector membrane protein [Pseudoalteromonas sp. SW0106-04]